MTPVHIPAHIESLAPYQPGKAISELAREKKLDRIVKLASNENPLGPSPRALEALATSAGDSHRYVDPSSYELTHTLAAKLGRKPGQIICGAGTDSLLSYILMAFSARGAEVLTAAGTFIGIFVNTRKLNRKLKTVPLADHKFDLDAMAKAITEETKIVYIANPNNPTGSIVTRDELDMFLKRVPEHVLVILDEAYFNYAHDDSEYPDGLTYELPNLIVTRTFSKDFGLAGLRIGFAVADERLIKTLYRVRLPFEPCYAAQLAALAALADNEFLDRTLAQNARSLEVMSAGLNDLGIRFIQSRANFLSMIFDSEELARSFTSACLNRGLILRHTNTFGVPEGVRMNSGTDDETSFALNIIADVYPGLADA
ncbi:MAG: histidinol-phosphate transaminase, partial [Candidatus Zixiibacteriota bacterium]